MNRLSLAAIASLSVVLLTSVACDGDEEAPAATDGAAAAPAAPADAPAAAGAPAVASGAAKPWLDDTANPEWSCAAFCVGSYTCSLDGPSKWDKTFRTSVGRTAAEAFNALYSKCEADGASDIVKGFHCMGSQPLYDWASLDDACARTR